MRAHRAEQSAKALERYRNNPASAKEAAARRRAAKLSGSLPERIPAAEIEDLYELAEGKCFYCQTNVGTRFDIDHYVPLIRGGEHEPNNLRIACVACNRSKRSKMPEDFIAMLPELLRERSRR